MSVNALTEPGLNEDRALSDLIEQYGTNFALTGDPNGTALNGTSTLAKRPAYNAADGWQVMYLDTPSAARPTPNPTAISSSRWHGASREIDSITVFDKYRLCFRSGRVIVHHGARRFRNGSAFTTDYEGLSVILAVPDSL